MPRGSGNGAPRVRWPWGSRGLAEGQEGAALSPRLLLDGATRGVARELRTRGERPRECPSDRGPGSPARWGVGLRLGVGSEKAARQGSLPPFSRPWWRLRQDMRSLPLIASWGRSARCPRGTVDRLARDQEAGQGPRPGRGGQAAPWARRRRVLWQAQ